jgi:hypothetical protein
MNQNLNNFNDCKKHTVGVGAFAYIAQTGTIIVPLSSADNSLFVQTTAPIPLGILALSSTLNALESSIAGEAVFLISMG